jgi:hypothetical protein
MYYDKEGADTMRVFEDDRYLCWLHRAVALDFSACLAQPDGLALLADRMLRLCAGSPVDPLKQPGPGGMSTVGELRCPPDDEQTEPMPTRPIDLVAWPAAIGGFASYVGWLAWPVLAVVVLPPLLVQFEIDYLHDHPSAVAQEKLQLGMTTSEAAELMNEPTGMFFLEPAHTEVWYFERSDQIPL